MMHARRHAICTGTSTLVRTQHPYMWAPHAHECPYGSVSLQGRMLVATTPVRECVGVQRRRCTRMWQLRAPAGHSAVSVSWRRFACGAITWLRRFCSLREELGALRPPIAFVHGGSSEAGWNWALLPLREVARVVALVQAQRAVRCTVGSQLHLSGAGGGVDAIASHSAESVEG